MRSRPRSTGTTLYIPQNNTRLFMESVHERVPDEQGVISYLTADAPPPHASQEI